MMYTHYIINIRKHTITACTRLCILPPQYNIYITYQNKRLINNYYLSGR